MKPSELLRIVRNEPVFSSGLLYAGLQSPDSIRVQVSQWDKEGKLIKLQRRLYTVTPDYSGVTPDPFIVANSLVTPSYDQLQEEMCNRLSK